MKTIPFILLSILLLTASNALAEAAPDTGWDEGELAIMLPIVAVAGLFVFLTLRYYFESKVQRAAIEKGHPIPLRQPTDTRKPALTLIALGLGYTIAAYVAVPGEDALTASIWGIIPLLIGVGLLVFHYLKAKEDEDGEDPRTRSVE